MIGFSHVKDPKTLALVTAGLWGKSLGNNIIQIKSNDQEMIQQRVERNFKVGADPVQGLSHNGGREVTVQTFLSTANSSPARRNTSSKLPHHEVNSSMSSPLRSILSKRRKIHRESSQESQDSINTSASSSSNRSWRTSPESSAPSIMSSKGEEMKEEFKEDVMNIRSRKRVRFETEDVGDEETERDGEKGKMTKLRSSRMSRVRNIEGELMY